MTKREYAAHKCVNKAMEGDLREFMKIEEMLLLQKENRSSEGRSGVLISLGIAKDAAEWAELAFAQQAPHRGNVGELNKALVKEIIRKE